MKRKAPRWPGYLLSFRLEVDNWSGAPLLRAFVNAEPWDLTENERFHSRMGFSSRCIYRELVNSCFPMENNAASQRNDSSARLEVMHWYLIGRLRKKNLGYE